MSPRKDGSSLLLVLLLLLAGTARVTLQLLAMPPYAGLDELYHVARLAFTYQEGRNPKSTEESVPLYLAKTLNGDADAPPSFAALSAGWPGFRQQHQPPWVNPIITPSLARPYVSQNYQAQHPSLYFTVVSRLASLLPSRTQLGELHLWRAASLVLAVATVGVSGMLAAQYWGPIGFLAAALFIAVPTWLSLIARASNDAFACALLAAALYVTSQGSEKARNWLLEGIVWSTALAAKLYTWPALSLLALLWWWQRAGWKRVAIVGLCLAMSVGLVMLDLGHRTGTSFGLVEFQDQSLTPQSDPTGIDTGQILRVFIASAIWPGGQHGNALTPLAMLLFIAPLLVMAALAARPHWRSSAFRRASLVLCIAVGTFLLAQGAHLYGFVESALQSGRAMPEGGMEGWYLFSLMPVFVVFLAAVLRYARPVVVGFTTWLLLWDVIIHEGALFRDYCGLTSPEITSLLFRWGPAPRLELSVLAPEMLALRGVHLAATFVMVFLVSRMAGTGPSASRGAL